MKTAQLQCRASILALVLALAACAAPQPPVPVAPEAAKPPAVTAPSATSVIGRWKGTSLDGQTVTMEFKADGKITVSAGPESNEGTYTVDLTRVPGWLDIRGSWAGESGLSTLIEVIDANHLRVEDNPPGEPRPVALGPDSTIFTRE